MTSIDQISTKWPNHWQYHEPIECRIRTTSSLSSRQSKSFSPSDTRLISNRLLDRMNETIFRQFDLSTMTCIRHDQCVDEISAMRDAWTAHNKWFIRDWSSPIRSHLHANKSRKWHSGMIWWRILAARKVIPLHTKWCAEHDSVDVQVAKVCKTCEHANGWRPSIIKWPSPIKCFLRVKLSESWVPLPHFGGATCRMCNNSKVHCTPWQGCRETRLFRDDTISRDPERCDIAYRLVARYGRFELIVSRYIVVWHHHYIW